MPYEVPYHVHFISSVDPNAYAHTKVNSPHFINFVGWMAERDCPFPQQLILKLDNEQYIEKLQLVAHHTFIPRRVEVHVSTDGTKYVKLCDVKFGAPAEDRSAAERKTISVTPTSCTTIKLLVHNNHQHEKNEYNQVGLLSARLFGGKAKSGGEVKHSDREQSEEEPQPPPRRFRRETRAPPPRRRSSTSVANSSSSSSSEERHKKKKKKKKSKHKGACGCDFCAILDGPTLNDKVAMRMNVMQHY